MIVLVPRYPDIGRANDRFHQWGFYNDSKECFFKPPRENQRGKHPAYCLSVLSEWCFLDKITVKSEVIRLCETILQCAGFHVTKLGWEVDYRDENDDTNMVYKVVLDDFRQRELCALGNNILLANKVFVWGLLTNICVLQCRPTTSCKKKYGES